MKYNFILHILIEDSLINELIKKSQKQIITSDKTQTEMVADVIDKIINAKDQTGIEVVDIESNDTRLKMR